LVVIWGAISLLEKSKVKGIFNPRFMEFITLEMIVELQEAARNGCLYSLAQLEDMGDGTDA
jgi:hypothetical protein